jgi:VWFA-related protein
LKIPLRAGTKLYDAIRQTSDDLMKKQSGRKAIVLRSDGMDVRSRTSLSTAIEAAQRADTIIYAILFDSRPNRGRGGITIAIGPNPNRGPKIMERLARETGGGFFEVSDSLPVDQIYARIEEELRSQYSIGYAPDRADSRGKYRRLKLTTVQKGLVVRTRDGYYPK